MASFDFIECSTKAYSYCGKNVGALLPVSAAVIGVKALCLIIIFSFNLEANILRQGLIFLPAYFVEGWIIAQIMLRAVSVEQDPAYQLKNSMQIDLRRAALGSALFYVLTKLTLAAMIGLPVILAPEAFEGQQGVVTTPETQESGAGMIVPLIILLLILIWAFRLLWVYVPPALGLGVEDFLKKTKAFKSSLYIIGLWLSCIIPVFLVMLIAREVLLAPFPIAEGAEPGFGYKAVLSIINAIFDYIAVLVSSVGMAYGVASIFSDTTKKVSLW